MIKKLYTSLFILIMLMFMLPCTGSSFLYENAAKVVQGGLTLGGVLNCGDYNITNVGSIYLDSIQSDAGTSVTVIIGTDSGDDFIINNGSAIFTVEGDNENVTSTGNYTINKADPSIIFDTLNATDTDFWIGIQEDSNGVDDDTFCIGDGTTPGTNSFLTIDTNGAGAFGAWGYTGEHIALTDSSSNTNAGFGEYFEISSSISSGKTMAAEYSRLMCRTAQTNQATLVGTESQFRLYGVDLADGVHAGLWAYAEQSGTSALSGGGTFDAISAAIESAAGFSAGATEHVTGVTIDSSINASATINASTNFSGIYIKSNGKDWFDGIYITGATNDIKLKNGATINNTSADLLTITEVATNFTGNLSVTGKTISTPSTDTSLLAATQITVTRKIMRVVGNGGAVTLTGTPIIVASDDGTEVIIQGTHDTNTVTLQDESSNAGSKLQLSGGNDFTLGQGDTIYLIYDSGDTNWYEVTRSDN